MSDDVLAELRRLSDACAPPTWKAWVEGRDFDSGDSFIMTGAGDDRGEDIYISRGSGQASADYLDLIAAARTYLPLLIDEVLRLRGADRS